MYDRIGRFQDWQAVYEGRAIREIIRLGSFDSAKSVFEFGCGTGAFAAKLMKIVPTDCRYVGIDVSPRMTRLATSRLKRWAARARVKLSDGSPTLHETEGAFDRFVSTYVFELLRPGIRGSRAHRSSPRPVRKRQTVLGQSGMRRVRSFPYRHRALGAGVEAQARVGGRLPPERIGHTAHAQPMVG